MRTLLVLAVAVFFLPRPAQSQDLTRAQQEVWDVEVACWEAIATPDIMPCFHEDFVGWGAGQTVTTNKEQRRASFTYQFGITENLYTQVVPVDIIVRGNMAVVIYVANFITRNRASGEEVNVTERWTDIMINDGGRWSWISDHGVDISEDQ